MGLAFVLYCTPALRVFWKRFLTPLRVARAKTRAPVSSYRLRTSAQSSRSVDTRGALPRDRVKISLQLLKRLLIPPKRICSLWMTFVCVCDVDRRPMAPGRRAAAVAAAPTSTPKLGFAGKTLITPAEILYSTSGWPLGWARRGARIRSRFGAFGFPRAVRLGTGGAVRELSTSERKGARAFGRPRARA